MQGLRSVLMRMLKKCRCFVKNNSIMLSAIIVYTSIFSTITILKYRAFLTSFYDLGIANQAFWTTVFEHKLFYETGDLAFNPSGSLLGTHPSFFLFLLIPFYAIYPNPENLLIIQSIIIALGALPIYWTAKMYFDEKLATIIGVFYLSYPPLHYVNLGDFHMEPFACTLLLFAIYYLESGKWIKFLVSVFLAMITIEFVPLIVISMVFYGFILYTKHNYKEEKKALKFLGLTALIAALYFPLALRVKAILNPYTSGIPSHWQRVLQAPEDIPKFLVENPDKKISYFIAFFAPLAFIPLLAPTPLVMTLPWFFASFLSNNPLHYWIFAHYNSFVIPFVFIALVKAIKKLSNDRRDLVKKVSSLILIALILFGSYLPFSTSSPWNYQLPIQTERTKLLHEVLALIPPNASVLTQNDIGSHVTSRSNAYISIPEYLKDNVSIDYVLVDVNSGWFEWIPGFPESKLMSPGEFAEEALNSGKYGIVASAEGILLLKRGYKDEPAIFKPYVAEFNYNTLRVGDVGQVIDDESSVSGKVIYHSAKQGSGCIWYGPYITLPPGVYEATFTLKVNSKFKPEDRLLTLDVSSQVGKIILSKKYVYGTHVDAPGRWVNVTLIFGVNDFSQQIEFRGSTDGIYAILLDRIIVKQLSPLPSTIREISIRVDELSITNIATRTGNVISHSNGSGVLWYGPYVDLPKGKYTVIFWLRLDSPYSGDLIKLDIAANSGHTVLTDTILNSLNFTNVGSWQQFRLALSINEDLKRVEFRGVYVWKDAPISLLLIEMIPDVRDV
jgi:uncharacterized membrane protein